MSPGSPLFQALDSVADSFDVVLTLLALAAPWLWRSWKGVRAAASYFLAALAGLGVVYGVMALDSRYGLWPSMGLDYSTHTAYAVSLATSIVAWDRRWTRVLVAAVLVYFLLIAVLGYHGPLEMLMATAVAGPATWAFQRLAGHGYPSPQRT